jgi:hypothetical protein
MDEISRKRAEKFGDSRMWSPVDALEDAIETIKTKDLKDIRLAVHWFEVQPDGSRKHHYTAANLTFPEHISLIRVADHRLIHDWFGD